MFEKQVKETREAMINFLAHHTRYYTMHSWNRNTSYANNVKLYNLDLPDKLKDKAYDFIYAECPEYLDEINELIYDFSMRTGYTVGFNGRSGGYLVLYEYRTPKTVEEAPMISMKSIDAENDFEEWLNDELRGRVGLITEFDKLCDKIRDTLIYYLENTTIENESYTVVKTRTVARISDNK